MYKGDTGERRLNIFIYVLEITRAIDGNNNNPRGNGHWPCSTSYKALLIGTIVVSS